MFGQHFGLSGHARHTGNGCDVAYRMVGADRACCRQDLAHNNFTRSVHAVHRKTLFAISSSLALHRHLRLQVLAAHRSDPSRPWKAGLSIPSLMQDRTPSSTIPFCDARPDHTFGSKIRIQRGRQSRNVRSSRRFCCRVGDWQKSRRQEKDLKASQLPCAPEVTAASMRRY